MSSFEEVAPLLSKTFIARRDVKAIQTSTGGYMPVTDNGRTDGARLPWTMTDLMDHLEGRKTFGHYLLSQNNTCKVICFDIDLEKEVRLEDGDKREPVWAIVNPATGEEMKRTGNARDAWKPLNLWQWCESCKKGWDPDFAPSRCSDIDHVHTIGYGEHPDSVALTSLLQATAFDIAASMSKLLEIGVAISYSGNKGLHVYGLVGEEAATDIRAGAEIVLNSMEKFEPSRGTNFYKTKDPDFDALSIEVFPKQTSLEGKDLGNLLRLPLGKHRKTGNIGFFLKYGPYGTLSELDPVKAITGGDPWVVDE